MKTLRRSTAWSSSAWPEAGEIAHWEILAKLNETAKDKTIAKLVTFAVPVQQKHVAAVRDHSLRLAGAEEPARGGVAVLWAGRPSLAMTDHG